MTRARRVKKLSLTQLILLPMYKEGGERHLVDAILAGVLVLNLMYTLECGRIQVVNGFLRNNCVDIQSN